MSFELQSWTSKFEAQLSLSSTHSKQHVCPMSNANAKQKLHIFTTSSLNGVYDLLGLVDVNKCAYWYKPKEIKKWLRNVDNVDITKIKLHRVNIRFMASEISGYNLHLFQVLFSLFLYFICAKSCLLLSKLIRTLARSTLFWKKYLWKPTAVNILLWI